MKGAVADVLFEGLDFEDAGAPAGAGGREEAAVDLVEPDVEGSAVVFVGRAEEVEGVEMLDTGAEERFEAFEVFVGFGEFAAGVAEDVFDRELRVFLPHVDRQRGRVLAAGEADDVADALIRGE
jgi:hypothetical protein